MNRPKALLVLLALALAAALVALPRSAHAQARYDDLMRFTKAASGAPAFLGKIVSADGGASTNTTTEMGASAFNGTGAALQGKMLLVQCGAVAYLLPVSAGDGGVTTATGVKVAADERVILTLTTDLKWLAVLQDSASTTCRVWELL